MWKLTATEVVPLARVTVQQVQQDNRDLTLRQMAVLLQIYLVPPPHPVRGSRRRSGLPSR